MSSSQAKSAKNATTMPTVTPFLEKPNSKGSKRISPTSFTTKFTTKKYSSTNHAHSKDSENTTHPDAKLAKEEFVNFLHFQAELFTLDSYFYLYEFTLIKKWLYGIFFEIHSKKFISKSIDRIIEMLLKIKFSIIPIF